MAHRKEPCRRTGLRNALRVSLVTILGPLLALFFGTTTGCRGTPDDAEGETKVVEEKSDPLQIKVPERTTELPNDITRPVFTNVAADMGIDFQHFSDEVPDRYYLPEVMGSGLAWLDVDLDGRLDLYVGNGQLLAEGAYSADHVNRLYLNRDDGKSTEGKSTEGQFVECASAAGLAHSGYAQGCAVGDFDADGFDDLFLANFGRNALFHNNGDGTFTDVTSAAGMEHDRWGTSTVWLDLDSDGDLDLYLVNYLEVNWATHQVCEINGKPGYCGPNKYEAVPDCAYLNQGDGTFIESGQQLGIDHPNGKGLAISVADFNNDRIPEIYVANDMTPNLMFSRAGPTAAGEPTTLYRDIAGTSGCALSGEGKSEASMGIACSDFDGDGQVDIFLTHFFSAKNTLYRNMGNLIFSDESRRSRIAATSYQTLGFGTVAFDYDGNGSLDLFVANGHVQGPLHVPYKMPPQLLHNDGRGRFDDISRFAGDYFQELWLGRAAAGIDFDNDGDCDLSVSHAGGKFALLRNDTRRSGSFIGLRLLTRDRMAPVGAMIVVRQGDRTWQRTVTAGGSYLSSQDPRILFAVPSEDEPVSVEITWPSGTTQTAELTANRYWTIQQHVDGEKAAETAAKTLNDAAPEKSAKDGKNRPGHRPVRAESGIFTTFQGS